MTEEEKLERVLELLKERETLKSQNALLFFKPYPKQEEFLQLSDKYRELMLIGSNQSGKSKTGAIMMTYHLTGLYPEGWQGRRFKHPIRAKAGSVTSKMTRDGVQRNLLGNPEDRGNWGTAAIPKHCIISTHNLQGIPGAVDEILIRHVSGGVSSLKLGSYMDGREAWQADTLDCVWFDEEPPWDIYSEGLTRTNVGNIACTSEGRQGFVFTTFTPLSGMSEVVEQFYPTPKTKERFYVQMGINDALHFSEDVRISMVNSYKPHERNARAFGIPVFGDGQVFPIELDNLLIPPREIPKHWAIINGIDFGWDHPSAAVRVAIDRDAAGGRGVAYIIDCYMQREATPEMFSSNVRHWGGPWAWPHDGFQHQKSDGEVLKDGYAKAGLDMLPVMATLEAGGNSLEASLMEVLDMMMQERLFIFNNYGGGLLMNELRQYHRVKGKPVKEKDDAISAMRYALMMMREAKATRDPVTLVDRLGYRKKVGADVYGSGRNARFLGS